MLDARDEDDEAAAELQNKHPRITVALALALLSSLDSPLDR